MTEAIDIVRAIHSAYVRQDTDAAERLISEDLTFTSPQDDHIDRQAYFDRCFPTAERFARNELREIEEVGPGLVFMRYVYELAGEGTYSNVEVITVRQDQIVDIQVYFGGPTTWS